MSRLENLTIHALVIHVTLSERNKIRTLTVVTVQHVTHRILQNAESVQPQEVILNETQSLTLLVRVLQHHVHALTLTVPSHGRVIHKRVVRDDDSARVNTILVDMPLQLDGSFQRVLPARVALFQPVELCAHLTVRCKQIGECAIHLIGQQLLRGSRLSHTNTIVFRSRVNGLLCLNGTQRSYVSNVLAPPLAHQVIVVNGIANGLREVRIHVRWRTNLVIADAIDDHTHTGNLSHPHAASRKRGRASRHKWGLAYQRSYTFNTKITWARTEIKPSIN